jgi:ankyrin repeat protein
MTAASFGQAASVQLLLDKGANIAAMDKQGKTALSLAAKNGHSEVAALLKRSRAKVD